MSASNDYKKKSIKATQAGFTLVEIAIVLVIIGLLLGGILKGQEMITQAKIKNVINDFNGITAAVTSYQDRYRAVPGDDQNAATRWASLTTPPLSGSGDGIVPAHSVTMDEVPAWNAVITKHDLGAGTHVTFTVDPQVYPAVAAVLGQ